jgi:hypothetical protein
MDTQKTIKLKPQKQNIGNAGEYYIASVLSANNFVTTITLGRAEKYDILALSPKNKTFKFSIKSGYNSTIKSFPLSEKDERGGAEDFYYILIRLNEFKTEPDFWVIPSKRVNEVLSQSHEIWRHTPGKHGQEHGVSNLRNFFVDISDKMRKYYPSVTEKELKFYYKNISQLIG